MKTIYKYNLEITDRQSLELPKNADILSVKNQDNKLCLWAYVDTEIEEKTIHEIEVFGTGNPIFENSKTVREFLGTCVMPNGLVWHVFKRNF